MSRASFRLPDEGSEPARPGGRFVVMCCRAGADIVPRPPSVAWRLRSTASPESRSITDSWRRDFGRETRPSIRPASRKRFCLLLSRLTKEGRPQARSAGRKAFRGWVWFSISKQEQKRFATRASPACWRGTFVNRLKSTQKRFSKRCELGGVARQAALRRRKSLIALRHEKLVTRQLSATGWGIGGLPAWGRDLRGHCRAGADVVPRPPSVAWRLRFTASPESRSITDSWRRGIGRETRPSIRPACRKRFCLLLSRLTKEGRPQARSAVRKAFGGWVWFSISKQEQKHFATRALPACWRGTFDSRLKSTQKRFYKRCERGGVTRETRARRRKSLSALRHEKLVTRQLSATRGHCGGPRRQTPSRRPGPRAGAQRLYGLRSTSLDPGSSPGRQKSQGPATQEQRRFATRASPAFWRGTFDSRLKSTQKRF